jgi:hypothetical protein
MLYIGGANRFNFSRLPGKIDVNMSLKRMVQMSRALIVGLKMSMHNPSKRELIYLTNLLCTTHQLTPVTVRYTVLEDDILVRTDKILSTKPNIKIASHLATFDYNDTDLNVHSLLDSIERGR